VVCQCRGRLPVKEFCPSSVPLILSAKTGAGQNGTKSPRGDFCPPILSGDPILLFLILSGFCPEFCPVGNLARICPAAPFYVVTTDRRVG
jgi:hypothetical protein